MPSLKLTTDITIAFSVRDRGQSADWYSKHFGFAVSATYPEMGWTELQTSTPGVILGLGDMEAPKPGNCVPVFGVLDLDASRAILEHADVKFDGDTITVPGMTKIATLYDPDGNALMISEDLAKDAE